MHMICYAIVETFIYLLKLMNRNIKLMKEMKSQQKTYYVVNITIALKDNDCDKISALIGKIATELYPDRYNYKNIYYVIDNSYYDYFHHCQQAQQYPVRVVSFTIE